MTCTCLSCIFLIVTEFIILPHGPSAGDTTLTLVLDDISGVYVTGSPVYIPGIQIDEETYERLYVSDVIGAMHVCMLESCSFSQY